MSVFEQYVKAIPEDKNCVQAFVEDLAKSDAEVDEPYKFLILQAASFGGKQVWNDGKRWRHSSFRSYWQPTATSIRRSPINPIQPNPNVLFARVSDIVTRCYGVRGIQADAQDITAHLNDIPHQKIVAYIDPPYSGTTVYGYTCNALGIVQQLLDVSVPVVYVSEAHALTSEAIMLNKSGAKGGITGKRSGRNAEFVSVFRK